MKGIQLSGAVPGCLGSIFSMLTGIVEVETIVGALIVSSICTVAGWFINRGLNRLFK